MARTPGRQTERPDDEPELQVDELSVFDIGQRLVELGKQLQAVGAYTDDDDLRDVIHQANEIGEDDVFEHVGRRVDGAVRSTLTGLREFRRSYDYWERVITEFALSKRNFTQRDAAQLLGVSTATINRWAQHPVEVPTYR